MAVGHICSKIIRCFGFADWLLEFVGPELLEKCCPNYDGAHNMSLHPIGYPSNDTTPLSVANLTRLNNVSTVSAYVLDLFELYYLYKLPNFSLF